VPAFAAHLASTVCTCVCKRGKQRMASPVTLHARSGGAGYQSSLIGLRTTQRRVKSMNEPVVVLIVAGLLVGASLDSQSYAVRIIVEPPATSCLPPSIHRKQLDAATCTVPALLAHNPPSTVVQAHTAPHPWARAKICQSTRPMHYPSSII